MLNYTIKSSILFLLLVVILANIFSIPVNAQEYRNATQNIKQYNSVEDIQLNSVEQMQYDKIISDIKIEEVPKPQNLLNPISPTALNIEKSTSPQSVIINGDGSNYCKAPYYKTVKVSAAALGVYSSTAVLSSRLAAKINGLLGAAVLVSGEVAALASAIIYYNQHNGVYATLLVTTKYQTSNAGNPSDPYSWHCISYYKLTKLGYY